MVVEQAVGDHRLGAADNLFRGLKDEQVAAAHVPDPIHERARDPDHDPHVRVVAAGVHAAVGAGCKLDA